MFGSAYRTFVVCLIVAFAVCGVVRAANAGQPCASNLPASSTLHAEHASHQHSHSEKPIKESTAMCCGMCIVASTGVLQAPTIIAEVAASRADYHAVSEHFDARRSPLDPGIPKQFS